MSYSNQKMAVLMRKIKKAIREEWPERTQLPLFDNLVTAVPWSPVEKGFSQYRLTRLSDSNESK